MSRPASVHSTQPRGRRRRSVPTVPVISALGLALGLGLASVAAADVPPPPDEQSPSAETDFERGERVGRALGACVCPLCCLVAVAGGAAAAIAITRKKK